MKSSGSIKEQLLNASFEQADVCQYVADMALELRSLCKAHDAKYLAYLLEIVFIEANDEVTRQRSQRSASSD